MPNIASVLKDEIARVAQKEVRAETVNRSSITAQHRSAIAELKRRVVTLVSQLKKAQKTTACPKASATPAGVKLRFRHKGFTAHRKRLGLSAEAFGMLIGVSALSVYNWESGKAHPRASQLPAIAVVRKPGRREAKAKLAEGFLLMKAFRTHLAISASVLRTAMSCRMRR